MCARADVDDQLFGHGNAEREHAVGAALQHYSVQEVLELRPRGKRELVPRAQIIPVVPRDESDDPAFGGARMIHEPGELVLRAGGENRLNDSVRCQLRNVGHMSSSVWRPSGTTVRWLVRGRA